MRVDPSALARAAGWVAAYAQNSLEVLRYGGLETGEQPAPHQIVRQRPMYRLRRYFADHPGSSEDRPPVVLVHPMMLSAELWDVSATSSVVTTLHNEGLDPWVVDFGSPDKEVGGRERTLTDHVVAISEIVDTVGQHTGRPVHLAGYCQGGMLCYQAAAYRRSKNLASLVTFGSPTDFSRMLPPELPQALTASITDALADHVFRHVSIPTWVARLGFTGMYPMKMVRTQVDFLRQLHNRDALAKSERQRRFVTGDAYTGWSGPAIVELIRQIISQNSHPHRGRQGTRHPEPRWA